MPLTIEQSDRADLPDRDAFLTIAAHWWSENDSHGAYADAQRLAAYVHETLANPALLTERVKPVNSDPKGWDTDYTDGVERRGCGHADA